MDPNTAAPCALDGQAAVRKADGWSLTRWRLLSYGGLALPLALAEVPIMLYLPAFYAQELGISAGLVGLVFLCARMWDGLSDVFVGWLSDRSTSRFGRRKPWVILGAPFMMVATWFLCNPPKDAGLFYLAVWAALFYTAHTAVKIPYLSWGAELSSDYVERNRVTGFRGSFNMVGDLLFVTAPLVFLGSDAPLSAILLLISFIVLALAPLTVAPLGLFVSDHPATTRQQAGLFSGLISLAKDRVFVRFSIAILFYNMANSVMNSVAVFAFGVGLQLPNGLLWVIFILYTSSICILPLAMRWFRRAEKHRALAGGMMILIVIYGCHVLIPMGNLTLVLVLWGIASLGNAAWFILPTSMLADMIDRGEVADRERRSGAYMAIYNLVVKIGIALGVGLAFTLLALVGYEPSAEHHSALDMRNIRLLGFGLPALLLLPTVWLFWKYPITRKVQQQLRAQIEGRCNVH